MLGRPESAGRASCGTAGCTGNFAETFAFDIHALIKDENAPALETKSHHIFGGRPVNKNNFRKEFFRNDFCDVIKVYADESGTQNEYNSGKDQNFYVTYLAQSTYC